MGFFPLLGIALGLAMDAFSVAVASGIALGTVSSRQAFRLSFHFGLFQFGMPLLGWLMGSVLVGQIGAVGGWLAFALLSLVGGKMLWESLRTDGESVRDDPTRGLSLVMLPLPPASTPWPWASVLPCFGYRYSCPAWSLDW